jgi:hypothetical protein
LKSWILHPLNPQRARELRYLLRENRALREQLRNDASGQKVNEHMKKWAKRSRE